ncbi:MAG: hypothetical protein KGR71_19780 [Proteobacteria bacterium]|nr:hypothetical protein [Pseudomonadota bacterium]
MDNFVARANIDHFLDLLQNGDIPAERKSAINKLLIEEENKLSRDSEQLEFAESRAAKYRVHFDRLCDWRDGFANGSADHIRAGMVLKTFEITLLTMESFCAQMRERVNGNAP